MRTLTAVDPEIPLLEAVVYAKNQPPYLPLPVRRTEDGEVVSRWKPNWKARIAILFGADFYLTMLTFNKPLMPVRVSVEKPQYHLSIMDEFSVGGRTLPRAGSFKATS
jgi:hypothetical protein